MLVKFTLILISQDDNSIGFPSQELSDFDMMVREEGGKHPSVPHWKVQQNYSIWYYMYYIYIKAQTNVVTFKCALVLVTIECSFVLVAIECLFVV